MPDNPTFLSERLIQEGEKSIAFFQSLSPEQLATIIYTEGTQWTPKEIFAHFVSAEYSLCRLVENIAAGGTGAPEDFNINSFNEQEVKMLGVRSLPGLVEQFRENRKKTALTVADLNPADLQRQGRHPFLGIASLAEIIKIIYRHNQIHQREIRQGLLK
jgi:hypothetical protein